MPTTPIQYDPSIRFLRIEGVAELTQLCKTAIYKLIREGQFPAPIRVGTRGARFLESEVRMWMTAKAEERTRPASQPTTTNADGWTRAAHKADAQ